MMVMVNSCVSINRTERRVSGDDFSLSFSSFFLDESVIVYIGPVACHALLQFRSRV